jgi:hypothetical protein
MELVWGWCLPNTIEMVSAILEANKLYKPQCPCCGAILASCNKEGICNPCLESLFDIGEKIKPFFLNFLRLSRPAIYQEIMSSRSLALAERVEL